MTTIEGSRWVITGAAGTIGAALRSALADRGVDLVSTDLRSAAPVGPRDTVTIVDLSDLEALVDLIAGADGVVHLGGIADEADFHDLAEVNIVGTYHVLEAARRAGVPRVVFASSNRLTGMYSAGDDVSPDLPPRPDGFYGVSKVAAEALCRLYADKFGLSTISLRIGSYEERPGSPREQRTWLSPADAVRAFVAAMTTEQHTAVFYAVSDNHDRWWDLQAGRSVGYEPRDDAARWGTPAHVDAEMLQGGVYATPEYSTDRMRR
ncbi:NAD(P)-dependent oxidoreductase [Curtobacterium sp. ISL-83]|uniref:NAD-dependent epimerase/dehydratase family protein n=1 Tax=Curtobacterium sp. ISL-83 TaxID=2819145 RepID=UPI001BEA6F15|nr:NAD(P)-dependent oxidoreductase [Curtobacterium sp. ISL-83]MBT2500949.1 NAD(P)-dependent oxidoreductase [Curtobacterium sp. ISL-83]